MQLFFVVFSMLFAYGAHQHTDNTITVHVTGKVNTQGTIIINLYDTSAGFPTDMSKAIQTRKVSAAALAIRVSFKAPNGVYALSVMHDENNNGKMDTNLLGIPKEGYCVSNNVRGFMSAPSFSAAKFKLTTDTIQTLKLIY